jgi:predicted nucleic acid-binding protein
MIIVDTSIWIEFFRGNEPFFTQVSDLLDKNDILAISPVFGELLQGTKNNKESSIILDFWNNLPQISENELFIRAGMESGRNKWIDKGVGLIDSVIILAARETISFVWTLDNKLLRLLKREEKYLTKE